MAGDPRARLTYVPGNGTHRPQGATARGTGMTGAMLNHATAPITVPKTGSPIKSESATGTGAPAERPKIRLAIVMAATPAARAARRTMTAVAAGRPTSASSVRGGRKRARNTQANPAPTATRATPPTDA